QGSIEVNDRFVVLDLETGIERGPGIFALCFNYSRQGLKRNGKAGLLTFGHGGRRK
ncbi:MAG: hypothetical protein GWN86_11985, partial [Desulfobacterales bacterium]|nr:hypothetical protein [Desulfobacterales bacterium]